MSLLSNGKSSISVKTFSTSAKSPTSWKAKLISEIRESKVVLRWLSTSDKDVYPRDEDLLIVFNDMCGI